MGILEETVDRIQGRDPEWEERARARLNQLTMPHWALGRLMDLSVQLAGMTRSMSPQVGRKTIVTMAADHGVVAEGVSLYPQEVTGQMVRNFVSGGAGINALASVCSARLVVVDMGVMADLSDLASSGRILDRKVAEGTANIAREAAMTREQAVACIETGIAIARDREADTEVFGTGDMGIGNTTPSAAVGAVLTGQPAKRMVGRGTGIDEAQLVEKTKTVNRALERNQPDPEDPVDVLSKVGGFEIGGIAGLILGAASMNRVYFLGRRVDRDFGVLGGGRLRHRRAPKCGTRARFDAPGSG